MSFAGGVALPAELASAASAPAFAASLVDFYGRVGRDRERRRVPHRARGGSRGGRSLGGNRRGGGRRRRRRARARRRAGGFLGRGARRVRRGRPQGEAREHLRGEDRVRGSRARFLGRLRRRFSKRRFSKRGAKRLRRRRRRRHRAGDVSGAHRDVRARARAGGGRRRQPDRCARRQGLRRVQGPHVQLRRRRVRRVPPGRGLPRRRRASRQARLVAQCRGSAARLCVPHQERVPPRQRHRGRRVRRWLRGTRVRGVRIRVPAVGARVRTVRRRSHLRAAHLRDRRLLGVSVVHLPRAPGGPPGTRPPPDSRPRTHAATRP